MIILLNHDLTPDQVEALAKMGKSPIYMPDEIKRYWANVSPEMDKDEIVDYLDPLIKWVSETINSYLHKYRQFPGILLGGELTACLIIMETFSADSVKFYTATTRRESVEEMSDGIVKKISIFKHVKFRELNPS